MKFKILCACTVFAFAVAAAPAQSSRTSSGKCGKPDVQSIPAGDKDGHMFAIQTAKCETTGDLDEAKSKEGMFSEHADVNGNHTKSWGVYVETFDGGDKIIYSYTATGTLKDGKLVSGMSKFTAIGGTGKMKGIKASGTCKTMGNDAGGLDHSCTGDYTMGAAPAMKK